MAKRDKQLNEMHLKRQELTSATRSVESVIVEGYGNSALHWVSFNVKGGATDSKAQPVLYALCQAGINDSNPPSVQDMAQACARAGIPMVGGGSFESDLMAHEIENEVNGETTTVLKWLFRHGKAGAGPARVRELSQFMSERGLPFPTTVQGLKELADRARVRMGISRSEGITVNLNDSTVEKITDFRYSPIMGNWGRARHNVVDAWINMHCVGCHVTAVQKLGLAWIGQNEPFTEGAHVELHWLLETSKSLGLRLRPGAEH